MQLGQPSAPPVVATGLAGSAPTARSAAAVVSALVPIAVRAADALANDARASVRAGAARATAVVGAAGPFPALR